MLQLYDRKLFNDIFPDAATFLTEYTNYEAAIDNLNIVANKYVNLTWLLITSKFGNTPIRSNSEDQFKISVMSIMFSEAPSFVTRLIVQDKVRSLTDAELIEGETTIGNLAKNPDEVPTTSTMNELPYIEHQQVNKQKRSKLQAYALQLGLLENDLSETYVRKFAPLFAKVYVPAEYIYPTEEES